MPNAHVPAADIGLPTAPAPSRVDFAIGDKLSVLARLADAATLTAKGLAAEMADDLASEASAEALIEFLEIVAAEVHALCHIVTGEPVGLRCDLAAADPAAGRARFLLKERA